MRRMAALWLLGTAFLTGCAMPHGTAKGNSDAGVGSELAAMCERVLCREPTPIQLKLPGGDSFQLTPERPTPIVAGDRVTVYAGETVMVEATVGEGRLVNLKAVPAVADPARTLVFSLHQEPTMGDGTGMILKVQNPFDKVIRYRLGLRLPSGAPAVRTSACPVRAKAASFEAWPNPIFQIVATDFRIVEPGSPTAAHCE